MRNVKFSDLLHLLNVENGVTIAATGERATVCAFSDKGVRLRSKCGTKFSNLETYGPYYQPFELTISTPMSLGTGANVDHFAALENPIINETPYFAKWSADEHTEDLNTVFVSVQDYVDTGETEYVLVEKSALASYLKDNAILPRSTAQKIATKLADILADLEPVVVESRVGVLASLSAALKVIYALIPIDLRE